MTVLDTATASYRPYVPEVRLFATSEGDPVALDRRTVGFVRGDRAGTTVGIKIAGLKPVHVTAQFAEVFRWWTEPAPEVRDAKR